MSCLKLHWPLALSLYAQADAGWQSESDSDDAPVILSFPRLASRVGGHSQRDLLNRARIIHENRCCPICSRAAVVPVNAEPILMSGNQMPVPGTGALVGFACDCCGHQWDA